MSNDGGINKAAILMLALGESEAAEVMKYLGPREVLDGRDRLRAERERDLGAAFQIADDLLDATATPEEAGKRTGKDAEAGKATLVSLLGPERARIQAERLVAQAKTHLDVFGERADLLRMLADFVIERRS